MPNRRLLTVDYPGIEQRARIGDLVDGMPGVEVHHLMTAPLPARRSAATFAQAVLSGCDPGPAPLVMAYCMGGPIAHEVAVAASASSLVMIDGSPCRSDFVARVYRTQLNRFAERTVDSGVVFDEHDLIERPDDVLAWMAAELTDVVWSAFAVTEDDEVTRTVADDLVARAVDWMAHLITTHNAAFPPWPGEVVLLASREAFFDEPWPGASNTTVVRVDCTRDELVTHPTTRRLVLERL